MDLSNLIVIGHSLGAHIAGIAGQNVKSGRLPIIVGLDPAYPLFKKNKMDERLSIMDADYIQIIHTNGGHLSIPYPMGDADFYANWGKDQPGCGGAKTGIFFIATTSFFSINIFFFFLFYVYICKYFVTSFN